MALQLLCMVTRLGLSHISEGCVSEMVAPELLHAHKHLPPLPGFAGTQGCKGSLSSSFGLIRVLQHCLLEEKRTLENMELSEKAII